MPIAIAMKATPTPPPSSTDSNVRLTLRRRAAPQLWSEILTMITKPRRILAMTLVLERELMTYDTPEDILANTEYITKTGLGGSMFREASADRKDSLDAKNL